MYTMMSNEYSTVVPVGALQDPVDHEIQEILNTYGPFVPAVYSTGPDITKVTRTFETLNNNGTTKSIAGTTVTETKTKRPAVHDINAVTATPSAAAVAAEAVGKKQAAAPKRRTSLPRKQYSASPKSTTQRNQKLGSSIGNTFFQSHAKAILVLPTAAVEPALTLLPPPASIGEPTSSSSSSKKRKHRRYPNQETQTTTVSAMEKMITFLRSQGKFHDAVTVRNAQGVATNLTHPTFTNMSLSIRRQNWTQVAGKHHSIRSLLIILARSFIFKNLTIDYH